MDLCASPPRHGALVCAESRPEDGPRDRPLGLKPLHDLEPTIRHSAPDVTSSRFAPPQSSHLLRAPPPPCCWSTIGCWALACWALVAEHVTLSYMRLKTRGTPAMIVGCRAGMSCVTCDRSPHRQDT